VKTPYVVVMQHDLPFKYPERVSFDAIARDMMRDPELKYVGFIIGTTIWSPMS
jgi:uncharacterized protein YbaA (DUF1428 family)